MKSTKTIRYFNATLIVVYSAIFTIGFAGCKKLAEVPAPAVAINEENVYQSDPTAISVLTGIYGKMSYPGFFSGSTGISLLAGITADELTLYNGVNSSWHIAHYTNNLGDAHSVYGSEIWAPLYNFIFACNSAIEGLTTSTTISDRVKQQLLGEAKFMRAYFYFNLVNFYGDVPLVLSTDYQINRTLPRSSMANVYDQIVEDLKDAQNLLSSDYLNGGLQNYPSSTTAERVRPTKWSAIALLARVYLYKKDWINAESSANLILNNSSSFNLEPLNSVFLKNSKEAIWQLQPVNTNSNTEDAKSFVLTSTGPTVTTARPVYISPQLFSSFESGDQRQVNGNWINSVTVGSTVYYYPFKYKNVGASVTEYLMVFRLGEQYLIRAEARAQQNNTSGAQSDLNAIRTRAGLGNTAANDKSSILTAILHERQTELFTEWGHRWMDLKRTGNIDAIMSITTPLKANGSPWRSYQQLYPLPWTDISTNPSLVQNTGYN